MKFLQSILNRFGILFGLIVFLLFNLLVDFGEQFYSAKIVAATALLMSIYWITEVIPLSVTSLIPLIIFPITGIVSSKDISQSYINSTIFLFMGGFIIAIAMEKWNLHKRIAMVIISKIGGSPSMLILGFMISASFISMWISNTATAVMLLPIGISIIVKLEEEFGKEKLTNFSKALMLAIAYSCSIGGIATIIGTPPNLVFMRIYKISFPNNPQIYFGDWMWVALPIAISMLFIVWILLTKVFFRIDKNIFINKSTTKEEINKLGKISFEEKTVLIVFIITSLLWIFRGELNLGVVKIPGWSSLFPQKDFIDDGTVAIFMGFLLFVLPTNDKEKKILDSSAIRKIPWDIILLFGGGFALAEGFVSSGLSKLIGQQFISFKGMNVIFLIASVSFALTFLTELTSNTATAQITLPILASLAIELNINPLLIMLPATLSASFAFMLPVATPPNAIVFSSNRLKTYDMAKTGLAINFIGIIIVTGFIYFFFGLK
ncbi:MAG: SLC13/DASS family transporter [Ignavibacteriales bacterium]|nr:SLC13/DASS family transporter [Ignavibacteriales bacterium]